MKFIAATLTGMLLISFLSGCAFSQASGQQSPAQILPSTNSTSQTSSPTATTPTPAAPRTGAVENSVDLERILAERADAHEAFLEKTTESHEHFMESWLDRIDSFAWQIGLVVTGAVGAVLAFFGFKTNKGIEKYFKDKVERQIQSKITAMDAEIQAGIKQAEDRLKVEVETLLRPYKHIADYAETVSSASIVLAWDEEQKTKEQKERRQQEARTDAIKRLERLINIFPHQRTLAVFVGRLYRESGQLQEAIAALDKAICARRTENARLGVDEKGDGDLAVLLFNKACYIALWARQQTDEVEKLRLQNEAKQVLKESCDIIPSYRADAEDDEDLTEIREKDEKKAK